MSARPEFDSKAVQELAADYARIFQAGHEAGRQLGYAEGLMAAKKIVDQHFPLKPVSPS